MSMLFLGLRNLRAHPGRSASLGIFIAISGLILVLAQAFLTTITGNMEGSLVNALTGDVQARPAASPETDLLSLSREWDKLPPMAAAQAAAAERAFREAAPDVTVLRRVRRTVVLANGGLQELGMLVGLDPANREYQQSLTLLQGQGLRAGQPGEILLSASQAEKLQVKVGDKITVAVPGAGESAGTITVRVAGIGEVNLLSMFDVFYNYIDLGSAQQLLGYQDGQVTDLIAFLPPGQDAAAFAAAAQAKHPELGGGVRVTTRASMGGFILGAIKVYKAMFYGFIAVLLLIVGLLIMNLVTMVGIERRRDIGTLRAIGYSRRAIVGTFVGEIVLTGAAFGAAGVLTGTAIAHALSRITLRPSPPLDFLMGKAFLLQVRPADALLPFGIILVFTALAAIWPSYRAASLRPVELMAQS